MKKIFALLSLGLCAVAVCAAQQVGNVSQAQMLGPRICLLQVYDWQENAAGDVTVTKGDPFYDGGWTTTIEAAGQEGYLTIEGGFTHYTVSQPLRVDYSAGTVTLEVTDDPIGTLTGTTTTVTDAGTITVDSTQYFYVVNEAWLVDGAALSDVKGEILEDGSIHIAGGFAYYIETTKTTTIRTKDGQTQVVNDETKTVSRLYRNTWLRVPNGTHEFVGVEDGQRHVVDVCIRQSGDTVYVANLYGYGMPEVHMELAAGGTMDFTCQPIRDIPDTMSPKGVGSWLNMTQTGSGLTAGNTGNATPDAITWGLTTPWDNEMTWPGFDSNKLTYADGSKFVVPGGEEPFTIGDVNRDGSVNITDVTTLIDHLLSGDFTDAIDFSAAGADCNQDGGINITDVTALIDILLGSN